ncbi:MAG: HPr kinase/phosphatase C-terminal domain-containing protein [Rhodospirillaceae bacterium]|nr:HPr kinase/phosphatase C-terminal domain-containing protein [Rhodospirillaceae bacterium]
MIHLHATCISIGGMGILIRGASGSGKSDLALRLIDLGAELVSDDYCEITAENAKLMAAAPATIAGKLEIRGFGIVRLPHIEKVAVGLIVDLCKGHEIERLPETTTAVIENTAVPLLKLDPFTASAAHKVRMAVHALAAGARHT